MGKIEKLVKDMSNISEIDISQASWGDLVELSSYVNVLKDRIDEEVEVRIG